MGEPEQAARGKGCANVADKSSHPSPKIIKLEAEVEVFEAAIKKLQAGRRAKERVGGKFNPANFI